MSEPKPLKIRPFARLLTMLGEQLIKNERIALIELIKNSYDADATWVKVSFNGFGKDFAITPDSKIVIEDDGDGMSSQTIEKQWLNPASPEKLLRKRVKETTTKGRVIQGEKGIGRFAILKLGRKIQVISRAKSEKVEQVVDYDFSKFDDEFLSENGEEKELFIDDLTVSLETNEPAKVITKGEINLGLSKVDRKPHGTRIEITNLKGSWSDEKVKEVYHDLARLESIFTIKANNPNKVEQNVDFTVWIYKNNVFQNYREEYLNKLNELLAKQAVIRIEEGVFDERKKEFRFLLNGQPKVIKLRDPELTGLKIYEKRFGKGGKKLDTRGTECGPFRFGFYIFDFSPKAPPKYQLDKDDKEIIRPHRIYLYRDNIRVYPYGEPDDDWLRIDAYRGTISAGDFLSNDQVVGYVNITQKQNPKLKDKTSREGLIYEGNATDDFIALLQIYLAYVRQKPYRRYRETLKNKNAQNIFKTEHVQLEFNELKNAAKKYPTLLNQISKTEKEYRAERDYLVKRAETTEELAGVGLSVETASHDIMAIMGKAMGLIDVVIREALHGEKLDSDELHKELQTLRGMLSFIESQLKDIQLLFKSSKQRRRSIRVKEILEKVERIYKRLLSTEKIELVIRENGSPLVAKTTDAVLLQLFLNLFDNAVYWLQQTSNNARKIEIHLDGNRGKLVFGDNGPGVNKEDAPYIFEPFYSGKGEEGRGLGLYIAKQLLERNDYDIELADLKSDRILPGANFVVNFVPVEE